MSLTELIVPILRVAFTLLFIGILFWVLWKGLLVPMGAGNFGLFFKYKLFKKKYPELAVSDAIKLIKKQKNEDWFVKYEILKRGYDKKHIPELRYIYRQTKQTMGGL